VKAEEMLQKLLSDYTEGGSNIAPNTVTFNTTLSSWARCADRIKEAPQKAEELLELQVHLIDSGVLDDTARPDSQSFAAVMSAFARSNQADKVQQTYRLLHAMLSGIADGSVSVGSNLVVPFTIVLNAAAFSKPNDKTSKESIAGNANGFDIGEEATDDVYTIALQTYRELKEDTFHIGCKPDHMVFAAMLEVLGTHSHPTSIERRQMVQIVFEDACVAGEVSRLVIASLFRVSPDKEFLASLLSSHELAEGVRNVDELPRSWTRNVSYNFRYLKRPIDSKRQQQEQKGHEP